MELGLHGRKALVTGGSKGIGRAIAWQLAAEGCDVAICARGEEALKRTEVELRDYPDIEVLAIQADCSIRDNRTRLFAEIFKEWGHIDILVNNVGQGGRWGTERFEDNPLSLWEEVYNSNVLAAAHFTTMILPEMMENRWGRIVTISSVRGIEPDVRPWFNCAKAAEIMLMKSLALDDRYKGITFNAVAPGPIDVPDKPLDVRGRAGKPEQVADLVTFLCSNRASHINGQCIVINGGKALC